MDNQVLLLVALALPLAGAVLLFALGSLLDRDSVRWLALGVAGATLVVAGILAANYPADGMLSDPIGGFAGTNIGWMNYQTTGIDLRFAVGLDGLGLWLFALSALLVFCSVLVSWEAIADCPALFYGLLLLLECGCLGVFVARDVILFYVFFEFTLIPLFFLIGIWGSEERQYAANKFFVYTLAGSMLTFLGLLAIVFWHFLNVQPATERYLTFYIPQLTADLATKPLPVDLQLWIFAALFAGFAIKVPLFPLHTWLPLAHVQAPTAGSVLLAGVLLKIGTYGFQRFNLALLPDASALLMPWLLWLAVAGIIYGALVALAQTDIKKLIAYSSVSHLGYCMLGLFALNALGTQGAMLQMINHGISTGALFALVGMLYERYHTRAIESYSGLAAKLPVLTFFMLLFTLSSIGLPGLNGFTGEFLVLMGMFQRGFHDAPASIGWQLQVISVLAVSGVVLGAWYMLWLVQRVFFGPLKEPAHGSHDGEHADVADLSPREIACLAPLAVLVFWIGLAPQPFLARMQPSLNEAAAVTRKAIERNYPPPPAVGVKPQEEAAGGQ